MTRAVVPLCVTVSTDNVTESVEVRRDEMMIATEQTTRRKERKERKEGEEREERECGKPESGRANG